MGVADVAEYFEVVPILLGIDSDTVSVFCYFPGPRLIKEGDHAGTG